MVFSKEIAVALSRQEVRVAEIVFEDPVVVKKIRRFNWNSKNLSPRFSLFSKEYRSSKIRVVVGDDLAYVLSLSVAKSFEYDTKILEKELQTVIPHPVSEIVWDYEDVYRFGEKHLLQIIALNKEFHKSLSAICSDLNLKLVAVEPFSVALARLNSSIVKPYLMIHKSDIIVVFVGIGRFVIDSTVLDSLTNLKKISELIEYSAEKKGVKVEKVFLSNISDYKSITDFFSQIGKSIEMRNLDELTGIARKEDFSTIDREELNLVFKKQSYQNIPCFRKWLIGFAMFIFIEIVVFLLIFFLKL